MSVSVEKLAMPFAVFSVEFIHCHFVSIVGARNVPHLIAIG